MSGTGQDNVGTNEENRARGRFIILNVVRLSGALFIAMGLGIIANGFMDLPIEAGYVIFAVGVFEFVLLPILLARSWKSPTQK